MLWLHLILQGMMLSMSSGQSFSVVWEAYKHICSPPVCRNDTVNGTEQGFNNSNCCGFCECGPNCSEKGSCCLSDYQSFEQAKLSTLSSRFSCVTPQLLTAQEETHFIKAPDVDQVWMITKCATNQTDYKSSRIKKLCEDPEFDTSLDTVVPVTQEGTTFRNIYCAYCNGIRTRLRETWRVNMFCSDTVSFADENLLATIREKMCNLFYLRESMFPVDKCSQPSRLISRCNETGLWPRFDSSIALGCTSFNDPFNFTYKNYFCYICNTDEPVQLDSRQCSDPRKDLPMITPPYKFNFDLDVVRERKNDELLRCNLTTQFSDIKMMKCRNISCHKNLNFDSYWKNCIPKVRLGRDQCFSVFIKLTLQRQYSLRKVKFKQYYYLRYLKHSILNFLGGNMLADILTEIRLYPKFTVLSGKSYVAYLVMHLTMDIAGALYPEDILRLFLKHLNDVDIETKGEIDNNVYHASLAVYNITTDFSGRRKIYVPTYKSPDVDVLDEFDLGRSDVDNEFVGIMSDNECVVKEIKPFKKSDIVPYTEVGFNELSMYIENTFLVLQEEYLEKIFTNFEYELHQDVIYLSLGDFTFIYDIMPKYHLQNEVSQATLITSYHSPSIATAYMLFFYLLKNKIT